MVDSIIYYINENSEFSVIGWNKQGEINDHSDNIGKKLYKVEAGDIATSIISFVLVDHLLNGTYKEIKFNVALFNIYFR